MDAGVTETTFDKHTRVLDKDTLTAAETTIKLKQVAVSNAQQLLEAQRTGHRTSGPMVAAQPTAVTYSAVTKEGALQNFGRRVNPTGQGGTSAGPGAEATDLSATPAAAAAAAAGDNQGADAPAGRKRQAVSEGSGGDLLAYITGEEGNSNANPAVQQRSKRSKLTKVLEAVSDEDSDWEEEDDNDVVGDDESNDEAPARIATAAAARKSGRAVKPTERVVSGLSKKKSKPRASSSQKKGAK